MSLFRTKVGAFVLSSAIATVGGVFYGIWIQYLVPDDSSLGLNLSISYLAIIIVGGVGTIYGPIIGALLIGALPALIDEFAGSSRSSRSPPPIRESRSPRSSRCSTPS